MAVMCASCPFSSENDLIVDIAARLATGAADRFKMGHQASNPASTRALVQHRALCFLETALLILYGSNCLKIASVVAVAALKFIKTLQRLICG